MSSTAPVVLIFFNRPSLLSQVWDRISAFRPSNLIAISDGPRHQHDVELVEQCRKIAHPNWKCDFVQIYSDENLGSRKSVIQGLTKVFSYFDKAIILEDDCLPNGSFFEFCDDLLERYSQEERIFSITGLNQFQNRYTWQTEADYSYSRYFCTWGWASWKRSWQLCQWDKQPEWIEIGQRLESTGIHEHAGQFWRKLLSEKSRFHKLDAWDYQFSIAGLLNNRLTIFPRLNTVDNIGLSSGAHYSKTIFPPKIPRPTSIEFPLKHAETLTEDNRYDSLFERRHLDPIRIRRVLRRMLFDR